MDGPIKGVRYGFGKVDEESKRCEWKLEVCDFTNNVYILILKRKSTLSLSFCEFEKLMFVVSIDLFFFVCFGIITSSHA